MRYLVRLIVVLGILAVLAVVAYAYFGDMSAVQERQDLPVTLPQN
jgi:type II secretory pathway pseudopilin PulG